MKHNLFYLFFILVNLFYYAPNTTASPIINGLLDAHHAFKYHVSIHQIKSSPDVFKLSGGGSIISEKYILTVAHIFMAYDERHVIKEIYYPHGTAKVIAGTNEMNGPGIERYIVRVFIPSGPDTRLFHVDLALAELNANLGVRQHPDRLAIIPLEILDPHSDEGVHGVTAFCGFGWDVLGRSRPGSSGNTINKFMNGRILGRDECPWFDKMICVRNTDTSVFRTACLGDSGSGLVYKNKLVGVLSFGPTNCDNLSPIKFTRLYGYMRFIMEAQKPRGDHGSMHVLHRKP